MIEMGKLYKNVKYFKEGGDQIIFDKNTFERHKNWKFFLFFKGTLFHITKDFYIIGYALPLFIKRM